MLIGYELLRDNSSDTDEQRFLEYAVNQLQKAGCSKIFIDFPWGDKNELSAAMNSLNAADILVVIRFNSLGDDQLSFLKKLELLRLKGVHLQSLSEKFLLPSNPIETQDLIKNCFPTQEVPKQDNNVENHKIKLVKKIGRPNLPQEKVKLIKFLKANQPRITISEICNLVSISRPTYHKYFSKSRN